MINIKTSKLDSKDNEVNIKKVNKAYEDLVGIFKKNKLNIKEILIVFSNLGYTLGANMAGYKEKGPSVTELEKMYAIKPSVDVALMLNSLIMGSWVDDVDKKYEELVQELKDKKNEQSSTK